MKKIVLILAIVSLLVLAGCKGVKEEQTYTVDTDDGEQTTTVKVDVDADSWCPEGGNWEMVSTGAQGEMEAEWKIDKLETSGEYAGLCHVLYTATTPDGNVKVDYWFDESGENGFYEMDIAGQKIKQEYHA